jgi:DNA-binding NtrC family response regulator
MTEKHAILFVDDDPNIVYLLKKDVSRHFGSRFLYETASSASEALSLIEEIVLDGVTVILVVSDWLMPEMKGDELLIEIHKRYPGISAIMVSGYADPTSIEAIKDRVNLHCFISKPWDSEVLCHEIQEICTARGL